MSLAINVLKLSEIPIPASRAASSTSRASGCIVPWRAADSDTPETAARQGIEGVEPLASPFVGTKGMLALDP